MKKIKLLCKEERIFKSDLSPLLAKLGYDVRQKGPDLLEIRPTRNGPPLEKYFTPELIKTLEDGGIAVETF